MPLLTVKNLSKRFQQTQVLNNISFELKKGEMLFLLGPSGCGKTTLLRILAGFEKAETGQIYLKERLIFDEKTCVTTQQRQLGYVVQEGVLFPHLTVFRNIAYGLGNGKGNRIEDREKVEKVMALTGISELAMRFPYELSGGQQQRVALARALAPNPQLILLDEPFSALDEHLRQQIRQDMLDVLRRNGNTAIFVTHDRDEALRYADRIAVMQQGEILQIGTPQQLYWQPNSLAVGKFMGNHLLFDAQYHSLTQTASSALGILPCVSYSELSEQIYQGQILIRAEQFILTQSDTHRYKLIGEIIRIDVKGLMTQITIQIQKGQIQLETSHHVEYRMGDKICLGFEDRAIFFVNG